MLAANNGDRANEKKGISQEHYGPCRRARTHARRFSVERPQWEGESVHALHTACALMYARCRHISCLMPAMDVRALIENRAVF